MFLFILCFFHPFFFVRIFFFTVSLSSYEHTHNPDYITVSWLYTLINYSITKMENFIKMSYEGPLTQSVSQATEFKTGRYVSESSLEVTKHELWTSGKADFSRRYKTLGDESRNVPSLHSFVTSSLECTMQTEPTSSNVLWNMERR
jgi:hypothetical protein